MPSQQAPGGRPNGHDRPHGRPAAVNCGEDGQKGLEGVALERTPTGTRLAVAFQAPLDDDPPDCTRIGLVDPETGTWSFFFYPLDRNGAGDLTGLSEILHLRDRTYAAIERDGKEESDP